MCLKVILFSLLLPATIFARDNDSRKAVEFVIKAQYETNARFGANRTCMVCSFGMSTESAVAGQESACSDLYGAACLGPDGKSKYAVRMASLPQELSRFPVEARNLAAKSLGFKDFDEALKARLKQEGVELNEPLDPEAFRRLKREDGMNGAFGDAAKTLFAGIEQCMDDLNAVQDIPVHGLTDLKELRDAAAKYEEFTNKYRELSIVYLAKDIPNFVSNNIGSKCRSLESTTAHKPEDNQADVEVCRKMGQLRREAIDLFRKEGTPEYKSLAEKFVRDNFIPELKYNLSAGGVGPPSKKSEADKLKEFISQSRSSMSGYCMNYSAQIEALANKAFGDFAHELNLSKPSVESLIDSFYSSERKVSAMKMFDEVREDVKELVSRFVKDPAKRQEILKGYDGLNLYWMEKPAASAYKKNGSGFLVLDEDKATPAAIRRFTDDLYKKFSDPSLSYFTTLGADYMVTTKVGKFANAERVHMMPAFIQNLESNPYAFLSALAHEVGHKIGPQVSQISGYDLNPEYKDLIACFKSSDSIKMQNQQADETIADYISSEVLAIQLSRLPPEKRQQALLSSMEPLCIFDEGGSDLVSCKDVHPENSLRIAGIFGANPNLRKVVGCSGDSAKYRSCGLGGAR